ncbi:MAG TPA: helix-turn-helix domain-containing protein [Rhizomicrobium sp.]|nr:helix-turn-helix domain-containing protein [Rhizomicrobium sp.]
MNQIASEKLERLLTTAEAEQILGVHAGFLNKDRVTGGRLRFVRVGRCVRYERREIESFIASNVRRSTSDTGTAR